MTVTTDELATYLGVSDLNVERAQMLIDDAVADALSVVTVGVVSDGGPTDANLPPGSDAVIRAAAGRLYVNTGGAVAETIGPYSITRPAPSGATLSLRERRKLLRLAGRGGAFSIDTTPPGAVDIIDPLREDIEVDEQVSLDYPW